MTRYGGETGDCWNLVVGDMLPLSLWCLRHSI